MSRTSDPVYKSNRRRVIRDSDTCALCLAPLVPEAKWPHPLSSSADHINPVARGGSNSGPLQAVHLVCNQKRGADKPRQQTQRRAQQTANRHTRAW